MRHITFFGFLLIISFLFQACQNESSKWELQPLDLTSYGLPIIIQAPDSATIIPNIMAFEKGVTVSKADFSMEVELLDIYADPSKNIDSILVKKIKSIEAHENYDQTFVTKTNGLIYSTQDSIIGLDHHFYLVAFKNGKQIEFKEAPNVMANYTLEEMKSIYRVAELSIQ